MTKTFSILQRYLAILLPAIAFIVYYLSNPLSGSYYDYTLRIAGALVKGQLGLEEQPPSWLNEMIPFNGKYYSAFPLGSILTMAPLAILKEFGLIDSFPGVFLAALLAGIMTFLFFELSAKYHDNLGRRIVLTLFPVFGTWMWANLAFAGAWHIALGIAVASQLATLYFIIIKPNPLIAGLFFAIAFGNRTEIILLAPIFIYLIYQTPGGGLKRGAIFSFVAIPIMLGIATLAYNYARFSSVFDFGYARIPGVLEEPWYRHGIFSIHAIPGNAKAMLFETWRRLDQFPYLIPTGFGGSIFLSSPFLIFLFRGGGRHAGLIWLSWGAIGILTLVLWCHGNPGGWQFSYRYAMELLPWMFLILLENSPNKPTPWEIVLLVVSILINAYGTYLFLRSGYMSF
jgi:hypothetical protein